MEMHTSISIKTATMADLQTLLTFEQAVIAAEKPLDPFLAERDLHYYNIPELITSEDTQLSVAVCQNEIVACGYVRKENSKHYHKNSLHGYVGFMYVKPNFRGKKISKLILVSLKKWALKKGLKELRLDVYNNNTNAIKAYEGFGFAKSLVNMRIEI